MSRLEAALNGLRSRHRVGIIPYVTVGYPTLESTIPIMRSLVEGGADVVELGVPFSDPLADGATIQRSSYRALQNGVTLESCFTVVEEIRKEDPTTPVLLMGYYNPFLSYGLEQLCQTCQTVGVDGFIVPDLPVEEAGDFHRASEKHGLDLIFLLAPTSTDERIARVARLARGFVYCVSLAGVTGARKNLPKTLPAFLDRVRAHTKLPLAVGFGISTREHVAAVGTMADAAVIGSALIDLIDRFSPAEREKGIREYIESLR